MIDPALQQMIDAMAASGFALPDPLEANAMRAMMDNPMPMPPVEVAEVRDVEVDGAAGSLPARLYHPKPGETLPVAVLFHGGGGGVGTLEAHDALARKIAQEAGCAVLSVGYRLAPEHPFPAPLLDCVAAVEGLPARAASFAPSSVTVCVTTGMPAACASSTIAASVGSFMLFRSTPRP